MGERDNDLSRLCRMPSGEYFPLGGGDLYLRGDRCLKGENDLSLCLTSRGEYLLNEGDLSLCLTSLGEYLI